MKTPKLPIPEATPPSQWRIRISDGFCEYEYKLMAHQHNISIHKIYESVRKRLKADEVVGVHIPPKKKKH